MDQTPIKTIMVVLDEVQTVCIQARKKTGGGGNEGINEDPEEAIARDNAIDKCFDVLKRVGVVCSRDTPRPLVGMFFLMIIQQLFL